MIIELLHKYLYSVMICIWFSQVGRYSSWIRLQYTTLNTHFFYTSIKICPLDKNISVKFKNCWAPFCRQIFIFFSVNPLVSVTIFLHKKKKKTNVIYNKTIIMELNQQPKNFYIFFLFYWTPKCKWTFC